MTPDQQNGYIYIYIYIHSIYTHILLGHKLYVFFFLCFFFYIFQIIFEFLFDNAGNIFCVRMSCLISISIIGHQAKYFCCVIFDDCCYVNVIITFILLLTSCKLYILYIVIRKFAYVFYCFYLVEYLIS